MPLFTLIELLHLLILTVVIGYIFSGYIKDPSSRLFHKGFNWNDFKFALIVSAPGVVLHELGHKFVAMLLGLGAVFKVWFPGLGIAIFLKLIHSPLLIIAPGFVLISGESSPLQISITAFAGPLVNLILWGSASLILNKAKKLTRRQATILYLTKKINLFLFVFNMIPFPPLDGSKVLFGLISSIV